MAEIILPLDQPSAADALALVDRLGPEADFYKVGLELFSAAGPGVVHELRRRGKRVFLDLKLHDIPNTVAGAVRAAAALEATLLTLHTAGGPAMMEAARDASAGRVKLLGVTVLTSLGAAELEGVWGREIRSIRREVVRLAALAHGAGLDGVVASALEARVVRKSIGPPFLIVTPGIRPAGTAREDQKRVATPAEAVAAGADYLVVGRPVTQAPDPRAALAALRAEVAAARPQPKRPRNASSP